MSGEDALKQAEREFRTHDKRIHRTAKQRHETLVSQREARATANQLISAAGALLQETMLPANRLVELDQAWRALDAALLEEQQKADFAGLQAELAAQARARGEQLRAINRWTSEAGQALADLKAACTETAAVVAEQEQNELDAAMHAARSALAARTTLPEAATGSIGAAQEKLGAELLAALQLAEQMAARKTEKAHQASLQAARNAEQEQRDSAKNKATQKSHAAASASKITMSAALEAAEQALAEGHLTELGKHLATLMEAHEKTGSGSGSDPALHTRLHTLQAEYTRLKGWQAWGGEQAREELTVEAEALAKSSTDSKLQLKPHAHDIEELRKRWKELDRLGGAGSRPLWQRFDAALQAAYLPIAAHQQKLSSAREENLATRNALLDRLEAQELPNPPSADEPPHDAVDWKQVAHALDHFHSEWRKLGPVEHTVPHKASAALLARMQASVARLERPLQEARRGAQAEREQFISRAKAMSTGASHRDVVAKVRALQTEWQQHAKARPLARSVENRLWTEFKAATDAIFKLRDAAQDARTAEWQTHQAAREALIARLAEISEGKSADASPAALKRAIAEVETQWRTAGEVAHKAADRLEAGFRAALDQVRQHAASAEQRIWHDACDGLLGRLALCEEMERATGQTPSDCEARWTALPPSAPLPQAWEQALHARLKTAQNKAACASPASSDASASGTLDELLLQLEATLDLPSPPAYQAARRDLKLQALKLAMEGHQPAHAVTSKDTDKLIAATLGLAATNPAQGERLRAIIGGAQVAARHGVHDKHGGHGARR